MYTLIDHYYMAVTRIFPSPKFQIRENHVSIKNTHYSRNKVGPTLIYLFIAFKTYELTLFLLVRAYCTYTHISLYKNKIHM